MANHRDLREVVPIGCSTNREACALPCVSMQNQWRLILQQINVILIYLLLESTALFNDTCIVRPTCLLSLWHGSVASVVSEVVDFAGSVAGFGAPSEVGEREALVLREGREAEVLGAEEEQRVEQHDGGVGAQLLTLPQVGFQNTGGNGTALRKEDESGKSDNKIVTMTTLFSLHVDLLLIAPTKWV